jgi:hypothetical protein
MPRKLRKVIEKHIFLRILLLSASVSLVHETEFVTKFVSLELQGLKLQLAHKRDIHTNRQSCIWCLY